MPTEPTFTCATCDVEIAHHPTFFLGLAFCCAGCAADGPCMCSYDTAEPVPASVAIAPSAAAPLVAATKPAPMEVAERVPVPAGAAPLELVTARRR